MLSNGTAGIEQTNQTSRIILTPEQSSELIIKLSERQLQLEEQLKAAINANTTIQTATPARPAGLAGFIQPDFIKSITDVIGKVLGSSGEVDPRVSFVENIKDQLLYQKLGLIVPAPTPKVNIE